MAGFPVRQPLRRHRPVSGLISDMHFVYCASGVSFGRIRFRITANIVASTTGDDANVLLIMDWKALKAHAHVECVMDACRHLV